MKRTIYLLFVILLTLTSCPKEDICVKVCDGCDILDINLCECIPDLDCRCSNGVLDGYEEAIDCGGDCPACPCVYQACVLLTNDSKKIWKFVAWTDGDGPINPVIPGSAMDGLKAIFNVDRTLTTGWPLYWNDYVWEFDSPESPTLMILYQYDGTQSDIWYINKLTSDSLIIFTEGFGYDYYLAE
jgi:hypothetical protein